jgi:heme/copper-type cytochrome/quinol oxidase subunit 3
VSESPWPVFTAIGAFGLTFGMAMYMHGFQGGFGLIELSLCQLIFSVSCWWRDVIRESTIECYHTSKVVVGLKWGMILFITSEVMFFFAFFWSFFYFSFNPSLAVGGVWPPMYLTTLDPFAVPLLNTVLLLTSGVSLTWSHHSIVLGAKGEAVVGLIITLIYATAFSALQYYEYINAPFCMSDGVYGSIFYLTTGFHGFHVFVGSLFLGVCLYRLFADHFTRERHFGFEAAAWYWHFVDVVWLFLYLVFYLWGSY